MPPNYRPPTARPARARLPTQSSEAATPSPKSSRTNSITSSNDGLHSGSATRQAATPRHAAPGTPFRAAASTTFISPSSTNIRSTVNNVSDIGIESSAAAEVSLEHGATKGPGKVARPLTLSSLDIGRPRKPNDKIATASQAETKPKYLPHFRRTVEYRPYTILDSPEWVNSQFRGFYVLFWVVLTVSQLRILIMNFLETGDLLQTAIIEILGEEMGHVALVDFVMYLTMYPTFFMQKAVAKGYLNWKKYGWIMQHLYQALFLGAFIGYARKHNLPWIAQIFLTLHALVQMMKMHSYAVFNGYLSFLHHKIVVHEHKSEFDEELLKEARLELNKYPANVRLNDFFMFTMYPTIVYEIDYPRTEKIRWGYVLNKVVATLGVFVCMIVLAQQHMHPIAIKANNLRIYGSVWDRIESYPLIFLETFPPFIVIYLLTFYIIWDAILNCIAELTRFGDREFYRDWWNTTEWAKFARDWNVPVHNFLQRHVYTSSRLFLNLSKTQAMFLTFMLSSFVHELAMWVIFGRLRGYVLLMQLTQLPMQFISKTKFFRSHPRFGLVMFWFGVALGPSILCSLYLTF